jgi:raffinose/stachyose/melibiose transport system permease protein
MKTKSTFFKKSSIRENISGYLFILPSVLLFTVFLFKPFLWTILISLYKWDGISPNKEFVGLSNYGKMIRDPVFQLAFSHNFIWIIFSVIIPISIGLILAILLSNPVRGRLIFKTIFFMPQIVSLSATAIVWGWIYHPMFGIINIILKNIGLESPARGWLGDSFWALPSLIITASWRDFGFCMVVFMAALSGVDQELYDAAKIDGAKGHQCFRYITVPQLRNTITFVVLITIMRSLKVFDLVYIMTNGGPGNSTEVIATYLYSRAFKDIYIGYGCAISVGLLIITILITSISLSIRERTND